MSHMHRAFDPPILTLARQAIDAARKGDGGCSAAITLFAEQDGLAVRFGFEMIWAGRALACYADPVKRSVLTLSMERLFPGFLFQFHHAPSTEAPWPIACFALTPSGAASTEIEALTILKSATDGLAIGSLAWRLAEALDQAMGSPSCRFIGERQTAMLGAVSFHQNIASWFDGGVPSAMDWVRIQDRGAHEGPGSGLGMKGLVQSFEARACAKSFDTLALPAVKKSSAARM